jgi:hypothetical protein
MNVSIHVVAQGPYVTRAPIRIRTEISSLKRRVH